MKAVHGEWYEVHDQCEIKKKIMHGFRDFVNLRAREKLISAHGHNGT